MGAYRRFDSTASTGGSAATVDVTLQLSNVDLLTSKPLNPMWLIRAVYVKCTRGGGGTPPTHYEVLIGETSGWTTDAQDQRYDNVETPHAELVTDVLDGVPIKTDANGRVYVRFTGTDSSRSATGTGHSFEYTIDLESVPGS